MRLASLTFASLTFASLIALLGTSACRGDRSAETALPDAEDRTSATQGVDPKLDTLIRDGWTQAAVTPAAAVDDAAYFRRISLDLTGQIPTAAEAAAFASAPDRTAAVDRLLQSEAYAEHWASVYTDLLMAGAVKTRPGVASGTQTWLTSAFADGMGYDTIATELLTARGSFEGPGPYGFLVTHGDKRNYEALAGKTARVFLGLTLECAQCHDHPSDPRYTQDDFYSLAAYFARTKVSMKKTKGGRQPTITDRRRGEMRLPTLTDAPGDRNGRRIEPAFLSRPERDNADRRAALATSVTRSDLFAKTVVARTWDRIVGRGLTQRWDDLGGEHDKSHPAVLNHLAARFISSGYDHRELLRTLVLSDAYQRASFAPGRDEAGIVAAEAVFAQMPVRAMDADQLFRSLLIATGVEAARGKGLRLNVEKRKKKALAEYRFVFADDEMGSTDSFTGSVPQALLLLAGDLVSHGTLDIRGTTVHRVLDGYETPNERVDALYMTVYGRMPTAAQRERALAMLAAREDGSSAYEDLMHAMLLSSEFTSIH